MLILIDLTEEQLRRLAALAADAGETEIAVAVSEAEVIPDDEDDNNDAGGEVMKTTNEKTTETPAPVPSSLDEALEWYLDELEIDRSIPAGWPVNDDDQEAVS